jgi:predicted acetyltransferase
MCIETAQSAIAAVALAPLMVDPEYQNRGIGSQLTWRALAECRDEGESIVFVLGHPTYYPRFGFSADLARDLQIPFNLSVPGAFMALELKTGALEGVRAREIPTSVRPSTGMDLGGKGRNSVTLMEFGGAGLRLPDENCGRRIPSTSPN